MSIKDLIAKVTGLEARATEAFKAELISLKAEITGTIEQLKADLATAVASVASLGAEKSTLEAQVSELTGKLSENNKEILGFNDQLTDACLNGKLLDLKLSADATPEQVRTAALAVPVATKFKAYQGALNAAYVQANLPNTTLPAAPVTSPAQKPGAANSMKREAFFNMTPQARLDFIKTGGMVVD